MSEFIDSDKKVERAKKHIKDLNDALVSFSQSDFYGISVEKDAKYGTNYLRIDTRVDLKEFLIELALIVGDALHNLRSALDLLYYRTVSVCGGTADDHTKFPFRERRKELENSLNGALVQKQITPKVFSFILDTVQPYKAGNWFLWSLHKLNNRDKHCLLIPVFQMMRFSNIRLENEEDVFELCPILTEIPIRRELTRWLEGSEYMHLAVKDKGNATTGVGFDFRTPLQGEPVIPSLHRIAEEVTRTIEAFKLAGFV